MTILFVCAGNTCRSPLAVAAWCALDAEEGLLLDVQIASAGLAASKGASATANTQKVARLWGVDLSEHRARTLSFSRARHCDLVVAMTRDQAQKVRLQGGLPSHRVRVLGEFERFAPHRVLENASPEEDETRFAQEKRWAILQETSFQTSEEAVSATRQADIQFFVDIADPFGASLEAYESCAIRIKNAVSGLRQALRQGEIVP